MYLEHFGLRQTPFSITPDTLFFMNRAGYQDALNVLLVAIRSGEGFVKVTGEVGVGKTLLCRKLLKSLGKNYVSAYIHNPYLEPSSLLLTLADELGCPCAADATQHAVLKATTHRLLALNRCGKRVVVCLDEVQAMPVQTLETLRLLTNLETETKKLLQVVLFGQPELDGVLEQPSVRQLRQRITFSYELLPMSPNALRRYVRHRLMVAECTNPMLFSSAALRTLYRASAGIPRLINIVSHKALMVAYGKGDKRIDSAHVRSAVEDTRQAQQMSSKTGLRWSGALWWVLGGSLGMSAVALVAMAGVQFWQALG